MGGAIGNAMKGAAALALLIGIMAGVDACQRVFTPNQYAAARLADQEAGEKAQAVADQAEAARKAKEAAEQELMEASTALYSIRASAPATPEAAEGLRQREAAAVARWEAAQLAVNGPDWRQHQADLEGDATDTARRKLRLPR